SMTAWGAGLAIVVVGLCFIFWGGASGPAGNAVQVLVGNRRQQLGLVLIVAGFIATVLLAV
ncbi:MAG TPA: hypothetical protein VFW96_29605, partial [Thermomicrobiales bacterium]|nr:hypothetical protein [Thermomicrobiales bacterium]